MSNPHQSHTHIRKLFDKYDVNHDGGISPHEFKQLCADMGYFLSAQEIEMDLRLLDTDGNGSIGFQEFIQWWRTENRFKALQWTPEQIQTLQVIRNDFDRFDHDQSGRIDIHEFKLLYQELLARKMTSKSLLQTLSEVDTNRDGKVSFNEYVQWLMRNK